jgi:predicted nucleic acid-binding protein
METNEILDTSIAIERKNGTVTIFTAVEHPPVARKDFTILFPEALDYVKAVEIANKLREVGKPIGAIDILIAAMCLNRSSLLITKDADFKIIQDIHGEFRLKIC